MDLFMLMSLTSTQTSLPNSGPIQPVVYQSNTSQTKMWIKITGALSKNTESDSVVLECGLRFHFSKTPPGYSVAFGTYFGPRS